MELLIAFMESDKRMLGGLGEFFSTITQSPKAAAVLPGNKDATWPSSPIPSRTKSNFGSIDSI
ncbi:unannotated protein [freshwater metagenome]|uniref:Unannotated protein n=1 Tax=freshwater metagenome TaxID=449393 RepID=A0A6J6D2P7_9ZZZZ